MEFNVNHPILFVLAGAVILYVIGLSVFFMRKAWRRARELKLDA